MEIRVLKYFLAVVREESITKAAKVLHITQPTLSRQLAQMEEDIGVKLIERGGRKIKLTNEGMLLRRRAEEILQLVDKTERELIEQEEYIEGFVNIGCGELASVSVLADLCDSFLKKYPKVRFDIYTATADVIKERIERGVADVGLLLEPIEMERFEFIRLRLRERWCVLMNADDPLAKRKSLSSGELKGLPLCLPRRLNVRSELENMFGDDFKALNIAFTSNLTTNAAVIAYKGLAYPVVIEGNIPLWDKAKVVSVPLSPGLTTTSVLAWKREQPFGLAATKFIEFSKKFLDAENVQAVCEQQVTEFQQCLSGIDNTYKSSI